MKKEKTTLQILRAARRKIADIENWKAGELAYAAIGRKGHVSVNPWDANATCFCAVGAVASTLPKPDSVHKATLDSAAYNVVRKSDAGMLLAHVMVGMRHWEASCALDDWYEFGDVIVLKQDVDNTIFNFNDASISGGITARQRHADVLAAFDQAIIHAREAGV